MSGARAGFPVRGDQDDSLARNHALLVRLAEEGPPVPQPRYVDPDGGTVGEPILVLDYLEGTTDLPPLDIALPALAELLAAVHRVAGRAVSADPLPGAPLPVEDDPAGQARTLLAALRPGSRDGALIADPAPRRLEPVLLHGDFWPGNVIWRDGAVVGLIDWEDAAIGDPECDLGTARTELTIALGADAAQEFRRCYDAVAPHHLDEHRVDLWTLCSAAGSLACVGGWACLPGRRRRSGPVPARSSTRPSPDWRAAEPSALR